MSKTMVLSDAAFTMLKKDYRMLASNSLVPQDMVTTGIIWEIKEAFKKAENGETTIWNDSRARFPEKDYTFHAVKIDDAFYFCFNYSGILFGSDVNGNKIQLQMGDVFEWIELDEVK